MDWLNQLSGLAQQYVGGQGAQPAVESDDVLHQLLHNVPPSLLAGGLSAAFRSDQTPPFPQMAAQLFGASNGEQRAGLLNTLIASVGPSVISELGSQNGNISGIAGLLGGGQTISPEQANQVSPEAVHDLAAHAEQNDPSIFDQLGNFYSVHPALVKTIGVAAIGLVMSHMTKNG